MVSDTQLKISHYQQMWKYVRNELKLQELTLSPKEKFIISCRSGDVEMAKSILNECRQDFLSVNRLGENVLHYACRYGQGEIVKLLLDEFGLKLHSANVFGETPFHLACRVDADDVANILLNKFGNQVIDSCNIFNETPVNAAHRNKHGKIIKILRKRVPSFPTMLTVHRGLNIKKPRKRKPYRSLPKNSTKGYSPQFKMLRVDEWKIVGPCLAKKTKNQKGFVRPEIQCY